MSGRLMARYVLSALFALATPVVTGAQELQLPDLPLSDLLRVQVERVFGASERLQPVTEAPASVTIVTADDIARYGYRTLTEVLRSVRGFYVNNDRNYSFVGVRGFGRPGDYNGRILLLVNGHRVNDNVFDQAAIGAEFGLDVASIDRVEIIRGPGSSLYGTNALFGVVNVVTQTGQSLNGASFQVDAGTLDSQRVRGAGGRRLANGLDFVLSASYERNGGVDRLYFPAFDTPATSNGVAERLDGERQAGVYGRLSFKDVTVTAASGTREKDVPTASFDTLFNPQNPRESTTDVHTFVDAQYDRAFGGSRVTLRVAWDRMRYAGVYPFAGESAEIPVLVLDDAALGTRLTMDGKVTRRLPGGQTLSVGAEFLNNTAQNQSFTYNDPDVPVDRIDRFSTQSAVYAQDELALRRWLLLTAGLRLDAYDTFNRLSPRGAVIVMPSANQSFKYLYGQAFRAPNVYELYYYSRERADLVPESIETHEVVWERYTGEWLRTSVSSYYYHTAQLITLVDDSAESALANLGYRNYGLVDAKGLELEAEVRLKSGSRWEGSYALQKARDHDGAELTNSPRHMAKMRVSIPLPLARSFASVEAQYLSRRMTLAGAFVAPHAVANATMSVGMGRPIEIVGTIRNLFDQRYADPASDAHRSDAIEQNGRTASIGLRWNLRKW